MMSPRLLPGCRKQDRDRTLNSLFSLRVCEKAKWIQNPGLRKSRPPLKMGGGRAQLWPVLKGLKDMMTAHSFLFF